MIYIFSVYLNQREIAFILTMFKELFNKSSVPFLKKKTFEY